MAASKKASPKRKAPARKVAKKAKPVRRAAPRKAAPKSKAARPVPFASRAAQKARNAASPSGGADPFHADLSAGGIQAEKDHQDPSLNAAHDGARASKVQVENYGQFKNKKVGRLDVVSNWYRKGRGR